MGLCESNEVKQLYLNSQEIDRQLSKDFKEQQKIAKLLLLGTMECGKTTLLKQMKILHANGFSEEERLAYREHIHSNLIDGICTLIEAMRRMQIQMDNPDLDYDADFVLDLRTLRQINLKPFDGRTVRAIKAIWLDRAMQERVLPMRDDFHLVESSIYFLDSIDRIANLDYVPTVQDILFLRVQTTGIIQVSYRIKNVNFRVIDVGGCRSERRKWIHCFDNVHAIIFLSAISEFDQKSRESPTNRLLDSMRIFRSICNSKWFIKTGFILFMNKKDLFERKLKKGKNIGICFKKFTGANTYEAQVEYLTKKFLQMNANPKKQIWVHQTCATDTNQISLILDNTIDLIVQKMLQNYAMT